MIKKILSRFFRKKPELFSRINEVGIKAEPAVDTKIKKRK